MNTARIGFLAGVLGLAVAAQAGCCRQVRRYPVPTPTDLMGALERSNRRQRSMRAKVTADQRTKKGRLKATVYLLANRRGGLRMEATVLDNTVAVLTSDGQRFSSIDFKRKLFYQGPAKPCNIARIFGIPLRPGQVALVLMGGMPLLAHDRAGVLWDRCQGREILWLRNGQQGLEQKIWIRRISGRWRVERSVIRDRGGRTILSIEFRGFTKKAGSWIPRWIRYIQRDAGSDVLLRYRKVEVNVEIPKEAYRIDPPSGYPVRWLDCRDSDHLPFEAVVSREVSSRRVAEASGRTATDTTGRRGENRAAGTNPTGHATTSASRGHVLKRPGTESNTTSEEDEQ